MTPSARSILLHLLGIPAVAVLSACATASAPPPPEAGLPAEVIPEHWKKDADPERYEGPVLELEARYAPGTFPQSPILFVGSSTFTYWKSLEGLWPEYRVVNRGFGGSQMSDLLFYFDRLVTAARPRQVFVYEGDNDLGEGKPADQVKAHFQLFSEKMHAALPGVPVVFLTPKPSPKRWSKAESYREFNRWLREWAAAQGWTVLDTWEAILGSDGTPEPGLFERDRLHLNAQGYDRLIPRIRPLLQAP